MNRITPTEHAEAAYQAKLDAKFDKATRRGPAGIPIPASKLPYRKTVDGKILQQIIQTAYASYRSKILTPERRVMLAESLQADLLRRFPVADMEVLERYKLAAPVEFAFVEILAGDFEPQERIALPGKPMLPQQAANFHVDLGGRGSSNGVPVPADAVAYFRDLIAVRREKGRSFNPALNWVGLFRVEKGRFPFWSEIERQFPLIGEWMEGQRNV